MKLIIMINKYGLRLFITRQWIALQFQGKSKAYSKMYLLFPEIWRDKGGDDD